MKLKLILLAALALPSLANAGANQCSEPKPPLPTRLEAEELKAVAVLCGQTPLRGTDIYNCVKGVAPPQDRENHVNGLALEVLVSRLSSK